LPPIIFVQIPKGSDAVIGAEVTATIDKPNGTQTNVKFNNLNIYCNYFTDYCGSGRYNVSLPVKSELNIYQNKFIKTLFQINFYSKKKKILKLVIN
jgi:hypothetical protein